MSESQDIPPPVTALERVNVAPVAIARPVGGSSHQIVVAPREGCSVASAVCGLTAIVPMISQLAGLGLGVAGLIRIRRARRRGVHLRGTGWAVAGLCSSGLVLACWIAVFAIFLVVGATFAKTAGGLQSALQPIQAIENIK